MPLSFIAVADKCTQSEPSSSREAVEEWARTQLANGARVVEIKVKEGHMAGYEPVGAYTFEPGWCALGRSRSRMTLVAR